MLPVVVLFALYPGLFTLSRLAAEQGGSMSRLDRLLLGLKGERGDVPGWVLITAMTVLITAMTVASSCGPILPHSALWEARGVARHLCADLEGP
jgi:hypothetical protein